MKYLSVVLLMGCSTPVDNTCAPACAAGYACVNGACVAAAVDMAAGGGDAGGACNPACGGLTPYCNAAGHCVGCLMDMQCPVGHYCNIKSDTQANCALGCNDDGQCGGGKCCNKACVDVTSDASNCGACGKACSGAHAQAACNGGQCAAGACDPGWGDCNNNPADGCETNLHIDAQNCTACGMSCNLPNAINACADGCYITACKFGYADCNQDPKDGCEQSVLTDKNNCGGCGQACAGLPNATANCTNGNCVLGQCNMGFANCDGNPANGCEANLNFDPMNCSKCGMVCPMNTPSCGNGVCTVGLDFGPMHTFNNLTTDHYITQGCCSVGCMGNDATDAAYFCTHFYGQRLGLTCTPKLGYTRANTPNPTYPKMHKNGGCTSNGTDIANTTCDVNGNDSACKIGNWSEITNGLVNLICHCM